MTLDHEDIQAIAEAVARLLSPTLVVQTIGPLGEVPLGRQMEIKGMLGKGPQYMKELARQEQERRRAEKKKKRGGTK